MDANKSSGQVTELTSVNCLNKLLKSITRPDDLLTSITCPDKLLRSVIRPDKLSTSITWACPQLDTPLVPSPIFLPDKLLKSISRPDELLRSVTQCEIYIW